MALEKLRQREVHKYYQSWLDSSIGFDSSPTDLNRTTRYHGDGSQLKPSKDKALIAFAQLGCLRLNAKRSVVTLISTDHQYILAEATRTLSLVSGDGDVDEHDEIWFGNASLPRAQGVSGDALAPPDYTAVGPNDTSYTAPALVIDDLTLDEKYQSRAYAGKGVTFYAGVPILTDAGIPIGVYTVIDERPRNGLTPNELKFMHDMAATVMRHLEIVRNEAARFRGETMVLGLGRFISGAPSLYDDNHGTVSTTPSASPDPDTSGNWPVRFFKGMTITAANPSTLRPSQAPDVSSHTTNPVPESTTLITNTNSKVSGLSITTFDDSMSKQAGLSEENVAEKETISPRARAQSATVTPPMSLSNNIFYRAAKILKQCVSADGVLFFDATSTNITVRANLSEPSQFPNHISYDTAASRNTGEQLASDGNNVTAVMYSGASEDSDIATNNEGDRKMCRLLGYAFDVSDQTHSQVDLFESMQLTERSLHRLVKLYPQGKHFSFQVDSDLSASDGEHLTEGSSGFPSDNTRSNRITASGTSRRIPRTIADELMKLVPYAQSIVWLPIWDFVKQRWSAGLFLWSRRPDKLAAAQDDLVYLKAFANSIMVEAARLDVAKADTAKSTFIANISHELRTPLHGVLGNLDILKDTNLNSFQQSLVTAIEVCGRTLCDTIDHVLDYSKINQLSKYHKKRTKSSSIPLPSLSQDVGRSSMIEEDFDVAAIVEEAVESAYASHAFQSSGRTRLRASSFTGKGRIPVPSSDTHKAQDVYVLFNLEHRHNWLVHSQTSAIRRVVTNLFGNALKYTETGTIQVSLSSAYPVKDINNDTEIPFIISIRDTGRGMSADFVRNRAFTPFSQESQFNTGTGLGLSIVQQIVKSLGGKIHLQSDQGVGTEIQVSLSLPVGEGHTDARNHAKPSLSYFRTPRHTKCTIRILTADGDDADNAPSGIKQVRSSLAAITDNWFGMQIVTSSSPHIHAVDFIMFITAPKSGRLQQIAGLASVSSLTRFIVIAANPIEKANLVVEYSKLFDQKTLQLDVLSHPVGPQKLNRVLQAIRSTEQGENTWTQDDTWKQAAVLVPAKGSVSSSLDEKDVQVPDDDVSDDARFATHVPLSPTSQKLFELAEDPTSRLRTQIKKHDEPKGHPNSSHNGTPAANPSDRTWKNAEARPGGLMPRSISAPAPLASTDIEELAQLPVRVLIVDDNDINLTILKTCMKRAQIPFGLAKDGLLAINAYEQAYNAKSAYSHVLMDISMPVMDGIQATREIREFERRQGNLHRGLHRAGTTSTARASIISLDTLDVDSPLEIRQATIIALSGVVSDITQQEMIEAGADMFLPKPVKLKELLRILES